MFMLMLLSVILLLWFGFRADEVEVVVKDI